MVDFERHNADVKKLWDDFANGKNERVPITISADEQFRLPFYGCTFREYYTDPLLQIEVQLVTTDWLLNNLEQDSIMGLPENGWYVAPVRWMAEREYFGCEVVYQENDYAWAKPLPLSKKELLKEIRSINPIERVRENELYKQVMTMKEAVKGRKFNGLPVHAGGGGGTHGIFTAAVEIRGIEQLCIDIYEDPEFVHAYMDVLTEQIINYFKAWDTLLEIKKEYPSPAGFGIGDDSIQLLSNKVYREFVLPYHKRLFDEMTTGSRSIHLCGYAQQHFKTIHDELGVTSFDGPGPFVDMAKMRADIDEPIFITARTNSTVIQTGPAELIDEEMKNLFNESAKVPGKFTLLGYISKGTPMENLKIMYESGKKHGVISYA